MEGSKEYVDKEKWVEAGQSSRDSSIEKLRKKKN